MRVSASRIVSVLVLFFLSVTSLFASSVTATGVVHSTSLSYLGLSLKIERPDGSKLNALCEDGFIAFDCAVSEIGEPAWGRAECSGGNCVWTCFDSEMEDCSQWTQHSFSGAVLKKEYCVGELYLTILLNDNNQVVAHCQDEIKDDCENLQISQSVDAVLNFGCSREKKWIDIQPGSTGG